MRTAILDHADRSGIVNGGEAEGKSGGFFFALGSNMSVKIQYVGAFGMNQPEETCGTERNTKIDLRFFAGLMNGVSGIDEFSGIGDGFQMVERIFKIAFFQIFIA